jgi:hypothetical protein
MANNKKPSPMNDGERKWRRRRIFLRTGQAIMAVGAGVAIVHWLTHIGTFGPTQPPLLLDFVAGYPMGGLILVVGAIVASRKPAK